MALLLYRPDVGFMFCGFTRTVDADIHSGLLGDHPHRGSCIQPSEPKTNQQGFEVASSPGLPFVNPKPTLHGCFQKIGHIRGH